MPTIKERNAGGFFITVKTKRGPRTRQITREGVQWLRTKFPQSNHASLDDLYIDYDLYRELQTLKFIFTGGRRRRADREGNQRQGVFPWGDRTAVVDNDTPPSNYRGNPPGSAAVLQQGQARVSSQCLGCGNELPNGAHFCSRCGRAARGGASPSHAALIGWLVAIAIFIFAIWRPWS